MFKDIVDILAKSIDVIIRLKKSEKQKWCTRLIQALFLLDGFMNELQRFHDLLSYYDKNKGVTVDEVVKDLEEMRLHPLSEYLRVPWVVIKSHYLIKDPQLGLRGFCLKYAEREDGIIVEYDDEKWEPGETPPGKSIIVMDQNLPSSFFREGKGLNSVQGYSAREYLGYLLNVRLRKLMDQLRDLVDGWSNKFRIWEDLLNMERTKILIMDKELHDSLYRALQLEGQFYQNLLLHGQAKMDVVSDTLAIRDTFFGDDDEATYLDLKKNSEVMSFLEDLSHYISELRNCSSTLRNFISKTFDVEEILGA